MVAAQGSLSFLSFSSYVSSKGSDTKIRRERKERETAAKKTIEKGKQSTYSLWKKANRRLLTLFP